jgi:transcriptional regulator with XRE-family HTH domain
MPRRKPSRPRPFDPKALGKFIATIRKAKGLSLGEFAEASSASKAAIANLENGSVVSSIRTIEAVCSVLGVHPRSAIDLGFGKSYRDLPDQMAVPILLHHSLLGQTVKPMTGRRRLRSFVRSPNLRDRLREKSATLAMSSGDPYRPQGMLSRMR